MIGRVISDKMTKSATVLVSEKKTHHLYKKTFLRTKKYLVDDPVGVKTGDIVEIAKIKPVSKNKHWGIVKILGKDIVALGTEALKEEAKSAIEEVLPEEKVEEKVETEEKIEEKVEKPKRGRKLKTDRKEESGG